MKLVHLKQSILPKIDALPADSSYSRTIGQEDWNREDALEVAMELGTGGRKIER